MPAKTTPTEIIQILNLEMAEDFSDEELDILLCMKYLRLAEPVFTPDGVRAMTEEQIADVFSITRMGLWKWRRKWKESGVHAMAVERLKREQGELLQAAIRAVAHRLPEMIARQVEIALQGKERNSIDAFKALMDTVVMPYLSDQPKEGGEADYAKRIAAENFDPRRA